MTTRVALALGSGGARGYAHIGALDELRDRGHEVVSIAGTSMGALVGGLAAAGKIDDFAEWARTLSQWDVVRLLDPTIAAAGAIKADKVLTKVFQLLDGAQIEDLPIPFTAVATDLYGQREVWFQSGPLETAIRASIAIPGVLAPVLVGGRLLADGGCVNPVPIEPTVASGADYTLAISLSGPRTPGGTPVREVTLPKSLENMSERLRRGTAVVRESDAVKALTSRFGKSDPDDGDAEAAQVDPDEARLADVKLVEVLTLSLDVMAALITRYRMAASPPDVLVTVPADSCRVMDFHRAGEMIDLGRRLTAEALDAAGY